MAQLQSDPLLVVALVLLAGAACLAAVGVVRRGPHGFLGWAGRRRRTVSLVVTVILALSPIQGALVASAASTVSISPLTATIYPTSFIAGTFTPTGPAAFTQTIPVLNLNLDGATYCNPHISVNNNTRPMTDVIVNSDGTCGTLVLQGNGVQAGVSGLNAFAATFVGSMSFTEPGQVTLTFLADDGWLAGFGPDANNQQPTRVSGTNTTGGATATYAKGYPLVGAYNHTSSPTGNSIVVNIPEAGTYPIEVDYFEVFDGTLVLNLTANGQLVGSNLPPATVASGPYSGNEGSPIAISGTAADPDGDPVSVQWMYKVTSGSGTCSFASATSLSTTVTCTDDGSYVLTLEGTDSAGLMGSSTADLTVNPVAPTATFNVPSTPINQGSTFNLSLTNPVDPSSVDVAAGFTYAFDCGTGSGYGAASAPNSATCTAVNSATQSVKAKIVDSDGLFTEYTGTVNVNQAPVTKAGGPYSGNEGSAIAIAGTASDPNGDPVSAEWTYQVTTGAGTCSFASATSLSTTVTCTDNGAYVLTLTGTDPGGLTGSSKADLTVANVAPSAGAITGLPTAPIPVNTTVNASSAFTDPGTIDTDTAVWDWGDGSTSAGSVTEANGSGTAAGSHTYTAAGVYQADVKVTDKDGGVGTNAFDYVVVYDPSAGFATGGGWINSPAGAYPANPTLTGKANFGFVSKYQKGTQTPTGQTEFQFQAANLDFHSSSYEWLVISGPASSPSSTACKAQYKGTGTINGAGTYTLTLTAIDGANCSNPGPDTFRIQITDSNNNVVYDNQPGAPLSADPSTTLGGGNIQIHS